MRAMVAPKAAEKGSPVDLRRRLSASYTCRPVTSVAARLRPRPVRERLRAVPLALWILLAVAAAHGAAWSFVTAPLNGPDEISHVAYVQALAETGDGPQRNAGSGSWSQEVDTLGNGLYLLPIRGHPEGRPVWDDVDRTEEALERIGEGGRKNTTGPNPAAVNPPLYYAYATVAWKLSPDRSVLGRIMTVRLATVLLMVLVVLLTWLVAAELFTRAWPRFLATALVALHPKLGHTAAQVNPDLMLAVAGTGFLAAALRIVGRGPTPWRFAALLLSAAAGALTHPRGLYLLPAAVVVLLVLAWQHRPALRDAPRPAAIAAAALLLAFIGAYAYSRGHAGGAAFGGNTPSAGNIDPREFASYVWQFYFPPFGLFTAEIGPAAGYGYRQFFVETFFGSYATFDINFNSLIYDRIQIAAFIGLLALYTMVVVRRRSVARRWPQVLVAVVTFVGLMAQLHVTSYASLRGGGTDVVITGRYLLPVIALYGVAVAFTVGSLPRRVATTVGGLVLGAAVVLCVSALGITFARFYA